MDIKEIQNLIKFVAKSGASEVKLETGDIKITIKTGSENQRTETTYVQQIPIQQTTQNQATTQQISTSEHATDPQPQDIKNDNHIVVKSPIIGTFYRKPSPDKPAFVEVGSEIKIGDKLCVIEAMKLFNEIESEVSGKIIKVLVDDSSPVEFDQPLFIVDPS